MAREEEASRRGTTASASTDEDQGHDPGEPGRGDSSAEHPPPGIRGRAPAPAALPEGPTASLGRVRSAASPGLLSNAVRVVQELARA